MKDPTLPAYQALLYALVRGTEAQLVYEIGVRNGYSTRAILEALDKTGGRLISCDVADCELAIQDHDLRARWSFYQTDSKRFASALAVPADVIYIDGSHEYADVRADVIGMWPLLKVGGVMILHDTLAYPDGPGRVLAWLQHRGIEAISLPMINGMGLIHKTQGMLLVDVTDECTCDNEIEPHPCPYEMDIHDNDYPEFCTCCPRCEQECADRI